MTKFMTRKTFVVLAVTLLVSLLVSAVPTFALPPSGYVNNGSFETGDFTGWTVTGDAFSVTNDTNWGWGGDFNHKGTYHVWGYKNAGDAGTGTLQQNIGYILGGYYVDFLISGGNDIDNLYVALVVNGQEVLKATGTDSETYRRVIWNVGPYMAYTAYIKVVDNKTGAWGHINVDDFGAISNSHVDMGTTLTNHDFESGDLTGWTIESGNAFSAADVTSDTTYWGGPFNQQGVNHLWSYKEGGDGQTGVLKSSNFILGGYGQVNFLVSGGNDIDNLYVALVRVSDNKELFKATGSDTEAYSRVTWDASVYLGDEFYIKLVDNSTGNFGHINLDDVNVRN